MIRIRRSAMWIAALVLSAFFSGPLALPAGAVGTAAQDSVVNGFYSAGDTVPQLPGRLSIAYTPVNLPAETSYAGPASSLSQTVDTAYDLAPLNAPADSNAARARDTVSYAYGITNRGNATLTLDLSAVFRQIGAATDWGAGAYKVFNDANNNGVWDNGDAGITTLTLAADASDTIVVVALVPASAVDGDSSGTRFFVTDRAPRTGASVTGDMWENGAPIAGNDQYDTQYDTVVTRVIGPNVRVAKTQVLETGRARPGDTIVFAITFDNDGADSANNITLYDAIPQNAIYVPNSADSAELAGSGQGYVTSYDDTYSAYTFNDTGNTSAKVIRWSLSAPLGVTSGDDPDAADFTGNNDAGRVYFKVRIK